MEEACSRQQGPKCLPGASNHFDGLHRACKMSALPEAPTRVRVVTTTNRGAGYLCNLIESAIFHGVEVVVVGWVGADAPGGGGSMAEIVARQHAKLWLWRDFFRREPSSENTIFVAADYDCIVQHGPETIRRQYRQAKEAVPGQVVMSSEENCAYACAGGIEWAPPIEVPEEAPWRWINSGLMAGNASELRAFFDHMDAATHGKLGEGADQEAITEEWLSQRLAFGVDYKLRLMMNMHQGHNWRHDYEVVDGRLRHVKTKTAPAFVHFNGFSKHANSPLGREMIYQNVLSKLRFRTERRRPGAPASAPFTQAQLDANVAFRSHELLPTRARVADVCACNGYERRASTRHDVCGALNATADARRRARRK